MSYEPATLPAIGAIRAVLDQMASGTAKGAAPSAGFAQLLVEAAQAQVDSGALQASGGSYAPPSPG
ncbi:MAG: hypothetical protein ACRDYD_04930, partial [Acidimicrobiales bacterium]